MARLLPRLAVATLVATLAAAPARAQPEDFPQELTQRPLTLPRGMTEVWLPVGIGLSEGSAGEPVFLNPSVYHGVTDWLTVGVRHLLGVCLGGGGNGCPQVYNDVSVDTLVRVLRSGPVEVATGVALNVAPLGGEAAWHGEVKLVGSVEVGPLSLSLSPSLTFGLNDRSDVDRRSALAFEGSIYNIVVPEEGEGNREELSLPLTVQVQLVPSLAALVGASLEGPLDPPGSDFGDEYTIPAIGGVVYSPTRSLDLGASLVFANLLGPDATLDERTLSLFAGVRF